MTVKRETHCSSQPQTPCHWGYDAAGSSYQTGSGSSNSQTPLLLWKGDIFFKSSSVGLDDGGCFPTRAVQAASKLSGHHLHYQSYPESQHVSKQRRLRADVHGQIHHNFLCGNQAICCKIRIQKKPRGSPDIKYLPEWEQQHWYPDHWLHIWECLTPQVEVDCRETREGGRMFGSRHCISFIKGFTWAKILGFYDVMCWHTLWWLFPEVQEEDLLSAAYDGRSDLCRPEEQT